MAKKDFAYIEPSNYLPEEIRKKVFGEEDQEKEKEKANQEIRDYVNGKK